MGGLTHRIVIPLAMTGYGNYISLLALDTHDSITRSFILSCITKIGSDLRKDFGLLEPVDLKQEFAKKLSDLQDCYTS